MQPALFLDRDGTLMLDVGYPARREDVILLPWAVDALLEAQKLGYALVVITNQSGVGRKLFTQVQADEVREEFLHQMELRGVAFHGYYECPHHPAVDCLCRKPKPGMVLRAISELGLKTEGSWIVGDKSSDIELVFKVPHLRALPVSTNRRWHLPLYQPWQPPQESI